MKDKKTKLMKCENGHYTISPKCPICNANVFNPEPPKFSLTDKYGKERRKSLYGV